MSDPDPTSEETPDLPFRGRDQHADEVPPGADSGRRSDSRADDHGHLDGTPAETPAETPSGITGAITGTSPEGSPRGGIEKIVTRLDDDQPPKWAMNWRPIEEESDAEMSRDHHPARIAGQEREPGSASEDASVAPTATSRTWSSSTTAVSAGSPSEESSRANRHPKAPRADATGRVLIEAPSGPTDSRSGSGAGVGRMLAGWLVALGIGLAWLATTVDAESEPSATAEEVEDRRMLARPLAPAEPDPSALLRQEIAALQEERTALLAELDAAAILMADHQRLTHEFDRTARRWRTATEQLRFLDESLEAAIIERARLATELAIVHRMLDEARDTD